MAELVGRKKILFKNGVYSAVAWIFPLILAITVTPIVVKALGNELYGLYAVVVGFITYSFTFGIGKSAAKFVAEYRSTGDDAKASEAVSAILWISLLFAVLGSVITIALARPIVAHVLLIDADLQDQAVVALYLACAVIIATMVSQVFQFVLQGIHRFDRYLLLTNLAGLFLNLGSVGVVYLGYGVTALLVWNLIVTGVIGLAFYASARRMMPELVIGFSVSPGIRRPVLKYAGSIVVYQVFGNVLFMFERGWIVRRFGPEALTFYVVPMMLGIYLHLFIASLVQALFPVVNELLDDRERLVRLYQTSTKIILTLTTFFVVTFAVCAKPFLSLWMSPDFAEVSHQILIIHLITFGGLAMITVVWQITESFHEARINAFVTLLWLMIAVPFMIALADGWQITGIAFARGCGVLIFVAFVIYVERRFLGGPLWTFWLAALTRIAIASIVAALIEWFLISTLGISWVSLVIAGAIGLSIYVSFLFLSGFLNSEERSALNGLVARLK